MKQQIIVKVNIRPRLDKIKNDIRLASSLRDYQEFLLDGDLEEVRADVLNRNKLIELCEMRLGSIRAVFATVKSRQQLLSLDAFQDEIKLLISQLKACDPHHPIFNAKGDFFNVTIDFSRITYL